MKAYEGDVKTSEFAALLGETKLDLRLLPNVTDVCESFLEGVFSRSEAEFQIRMMLRYGFIEI
jgi:hypothetical protein